MERTVSWARPLELLTGIVPVWALGVWRAVGQPGGVSQVVSPGALCQQDAEPQAFAWWVDAVPDPGRGGSSTVAAPAA